MSRELFLLVASQGFLLIIVPCVVIAKRLYAKNQTSGEEIPFGAAAIVVTVFWLGCTAASIAELSKAFPSAKVQQYREESK